MATDLSGRTPSSDKEAAMSGERHPPNGCAGCGHIAKHHTRRDSVWNGLMAPYRVVWRCAWDGCGCPEFVKAKP